MVRISIPQCWSALLQSLRGMGLGMERGRGERERERGSAGGWGRRGWRGRGCEGVRGTAWQLNPPRPVYWGARLIEQQHTNVHWQPGLQGGCPASIHSPAPALMHCLRVCVCVCRERDRKRSECVCSYHGNLCRVGWSLSQSLWMIPGLWHCHIAWLCCPLELCPVGPREWVSEWERERERERGRETWAGN